MTQPLPPLTGKQKRHLKALAHSLKPVLQLGKGGVTAAFVANLINHFGQRELLKVKLLQNAELSAPEAALALAQAVPCQVAQVIGKTLVLYKPFDEDPEIKLP